MTAAPDPASYLTGVIRPLRALLLGAILTSCGGNAPRPHGKAYPIRKFTVTNQSIYGDGMYAFAQGTSDLAWDTTVRDSVVSLAAARSEFVTVLRREDGIWRIYRQIFVMR
jgi:hypothetical protein